jgi:hypothetical protein
MGVDFVDPIEELKKREFNIRCKVIRKKVSFYDDAYENNSSAELIILEPYEGTERDMLMMAWYQDAYPKKVGEHRVSMVELPCFISSPIALPCAVRMNWPNEIYDKPHLMVISVSIEELFKSNSGRAVTDIDLKVFPQEMMDSLGLSNGLVRGV